MIKVQSLLFILFLMSVSLLQAQDINRILLENRWSAYDNFAIIDFFADAQAEIEYAYCSFCTTNKDTVNWNLSEKTLVIGADSLEIKSATNSEIKTLQYNEPFVFKNVKRLKETKLKKTEVQKFLVVDQQLGIKKKNKNFENATQQPIKFNANGKMWIEDPKIKGQWALKSFYGDLFLIYLHRKAVNRNFPLLKIISLKKGKFIGQPIPSLKQGTPFVLEISKLTN